MSPEGYDPQLHPDMPADHLYKPLLQVVMKRPSGNHGDTSRPDDARNAVRVCHDAPMMRRVSHELLQVHFWNLQLLLPHLSSKPKDSCFPKTAESRRVK